VGEETKDEPSNYSRLLVGPEQVTRPKNPCKLNDAAAADDDVDDEYCLLG
jgi:hypothetical protein